MDRTSPEIPFFYCVSAENGHKDDLHLFLPRVFHGMAFVVLGYMLTASRISLSVPDGLLGRVTGKPLWRRGKRDATFSVPADWLEPKAS